MCQWAPWCAVGGGALMAEVHWLGKAKEKKGEAVKVWKCVAVGESDGEEEDRPAKRPQLGPGVGKPSLSGTASEPSTGTAGEPSTTTGPGIRKPSPLPVPTRPPKKAVPKHPQSALLRMPGGSRYVHWRFASCTHAANTVWVIIILGSI